MCLLISFLIKPFSILDCSEHGLQNSSLCNSNTWVLVNSSYNLETYVGSVCKPHLLAWQDCTIGVSDLDTVAVNVTKSQAESEKLAIESFDALGWFFIEWKNFTNTKLHYIYTCIYPLHVHMLVHMCIHYHNRCIAVWFIWRMRFLLICD